jgi:hypothetical protein
VTTRNQHLAEIADCLDEAHRLQSRVIDLTEQVYQAAGMSTVDRALRGKVTGLLFGLVAYLDELIASRSRDRTPLRHIIAGDGALGSWPLPG